MLRNVTSLIISKIMLRSAEESDSEESSSDDDDIILKIIKKPRERHVRIKGYYSTILRYNEGDFQGHFRLTRTLVEDFMVNMECLITVKCMGRPPVKPLDAVLLMLWTLANQETFREVADRFEFSEGHAHHIVMKTCMFITNQRARYIKWPEGDNINNNINGFSLLRARRFPNVIGCVDGSHIQILGTRGDNSYYNRKGTYSVVLQAICNSRMEFIDTYIYTGWPGSVHDARVWRNSPVYERLRRGILPQNVHLLGDTAYPLDMFIMVPFRDNGHLTRQQKRFNQTLSSTRVVIEQAFGRLKGLWRRLKYLNIINKQYSKFIIATACVLHNVCVNGNIPYDPVEIDDFDIEPIFIQEEPLDYIPNAAKIKRNNIMQGL